VGREAEATAAAADIKLCESFVYFILRTQRTTAPPRCSLAGTNVIANASLSARLIADRSGPSVPGAWPGPGNGVCGADCRAESTHAPPVGRPPSALRRATSMRRWPYGISEEG